MRKQPRLQSTLFIVFCTCIFLIAKLLYAEGAYVGEHWIANDAKIILLSFSTGAKHDATEIGGGFPEHISIAAHPEEGYCWATNRTRGEIVKFMPNGKYQQAKGFSLPMSIALDVEDGSLWVADYEASQVIKLSKNLEEIARVATQGFPYSLSVSYRDRSCWSLVNRGEAGFFALVKISQTGQVVEQIRVSKKADEENSFKISASHWDGGCWLANLKETRLIKLSESGDAQFQVDFQTPNSSEFGYSNSAQNISDIASDLLDGGCWVVDYGMNAVFKVSNAGKPICKIIGFDRPTEISRNPSDNTFWVKDRNGNRIVKLPTDENEVPLAVVGFAGDKLRVEPPATIRLLDGSQKDMEGKEGMEKKESKGRRQRAGEYVDERKDKGKVELKPDVKEEGSDVTTPKLQRTAPTISPSEESNKPGQSELAPEPSQKNKPNINKVNKPDKSKISKIPPHPPLPDKEFIGIRFLQLFDGLSLQRLKNATTTLGRRYAWNYNGDTYTILIGMDVETYNSYSNRERDKLDEMVLEGIRGVQKLALEFRKIAEKKGWNGEQLANFVLSFVQSLPYTVDSVTTGYDEFKSYAFETLVAGGGDCEDTSILAGSMLMALGYDVVLINPPGHLAFGITGNYGGYYFEHKEKRYFYCESTGTGFKVGNLPEEYRNVEVHIFDIVNSKE